MDARDRLFQQLLADHGAAIPRVVGAYVRDHGERADLVQDIWLAVWCALPSFRGDASLKTFVFRIAHNRSVTELARRRATHGNLEEVGELADSAPGPAEQLAAEQRAQRLLAAVRLRLRLGGEV